MEAQGAGDSHAFKASCVEPIPDRLGHLAQISRRVGCERRKSVKRLSTALDLFPIREVVQQYLNERIGLGLGLRAIG
jgi:hypothetical protein